MSDSDEAYMTIILTDEKTGEPLDPDDPVILSKSEYEFIATQAEKNGLTFEEEFIREVRLGIDSLIDRYSGKSRITFSETEGRLRAYSYVVDYPLTCGTFTEANLPDDLVGEVESISQSDDAPAFFWDVKGKLEIRVEPLRR